MNDKVGCSRSQLAPMAVSPFSSTGPLCAYVDRDCRHHAACLSLLEEHPGPLIVRMLVVTEVAYLLETRLGWEAEVRFLGDIATGDLALEPVHPGDVERIAELVTRYRNLPLGTVDASVVVTAERLGVATVATLETSPSRHPDEAG